MSALLIKDPARLEIAECRYYYEQKQKGLGNRFMKELDQVLVAIASSPEIWPPFKNEFRIAQMKKFPFIIIYKSINENVIVFKLIHEKRNPQRRSV